MSDALEKARQMRLLAASLVSMAKDIEESALPSGGPFLLAANQSARGHSSIDRQSLRKRAALEYSNRRSRRKHFDADLFGEAAWDILLDLFQARLDSRMITVTSACIAGDVPPTTALRWLKILEQTGLVERVENLSDHRSAWVRLTDLGVRKMVAYFEGCVGRQGREARKQEDNLIAEISAEL